MRINLGGVLKVVGKPLKKALYDTVLKEGAKGLAKVLGLKKPKEDKPDGSENEK